MEDNKDCGEPVEELYNRLADSVLELSDEAITAEVGEIGGDPQEEAERIRLALIESWKQFDLVERCATEPCSIHKKQAFNR